jgi:prepilin-type processing-associated H-X9-DG protein
MMDAWGGVGGIQAWWVHDNAVLRFNHVPGGSNVLYMDGHVEFRKYSEDKWPLGEGKDGSMAMHAKWIGTAMGGFG